MTPAEWVQLMEFGFDLGLDDLARWAAWNHHFAKHATLAVSTLDDVYPHLHEVSDAPPQ